MNVCKKKRRDDKDRADTKKKDNVAIKTEVEVKPHPSRDASVSPEDDRGHLTPHSSKTISVGWSRPTQI